MFNVIKGRMMMLALYKMYESMNLTCPLASSDGMTLWLKKWTKAGLRPKKAASAKAACVSAKSCGDVITRRVGCIAVVLSVW